MKNFVDTLVQFGNVTRVADFGGVPIPQIHRFWEVGCLITIPKDYQIYMQEMPAGNRLYFVPVHVQFPDGDEIIDKFFVGHLFKTARTTDGQFFRAKGSVVDKVRQFRTLDDAFRHGLAGHTFEVSADIACEVQHPRTHEPYITHIYQFDFVVPAL